MKINDILDEAQGRFALVQIAKIVSLVVGIILLGIYIGTIFFGTNSLEVHLNLSEYKGELEVRIEELKKENAQLQKEYFELKQLEPQEQ
jgi:cell division protein FtsL